MKRKIKYIAIDPYYSDHTQVFIGADEEEINRQIYEYEAWLGRNHPAGNLLFTE